MKKTIKDILLLILPLWGLGGLTGCEQSFDQLEKDPNRATTAPASLVFQGVLNDMYNTNGVNANGVTVSGGVTGQPWGPEQRYNQFYASNYEYYSTNEYNWTTTGLNFTTLKNVVRMEEEAKRLLGTDANPYAALGKFFRAFYFENMTKRVGDIPMTDALKGLENIAPKYDTQKAVYVQVLKWLDESNADLTSLIAKSDKSLTGDIYLGNDLAKWQRVVNTFKVRVLLSLSTKDTDADLNVKARFAAVLGNPTQFPIMTSTDDDLQYVHNTVNKYSRNPGNFGQNATRENMAKTYVDLLVARKDPRIFIVAEPAEALLKAGKKPTDYDAFAGASSGESLTDMSTKVLSGQYSYQNRKRYYTTDVAETVDIIGYTELQFNLAEGINRGWAAGNAETFYNRGISTSMAFYGLKDGDNTATFSRDGGIVNFDTYTFRANMAEYLAQPLVKYAGNTAAGLNQILTQKYLAFFQNSGLEAWYNQRRTGIPTFLTGVGTGTGSTNLIPKRWQYPANERNFNPDNYKAAVQSQFGETGDNVNNLVWLLK